mgnify:CR=1 FL=1
MLLKELIISIYIFFLSLSKLFKFLLFIASQIKILFLIFCFLMISKNEDIKRIFFSKGIIFTLSKITIKQSFDFNFSHILKTFLVFFL